MSRRRVKVVNKLGLHARPAALLVKAATKYRSDFFIEKDGMRVNGKSIMGVMMLAAECGSVLDLIADGVDEEYLLDEISELIASGFGEE
ncbi:HPr family phosphocarrier protein [Candidatus Syntrophosphaera thermopropionivorans]|jgi:phosphocarrier protein HPr|uniref:HPr family phosphocarrier protein n=1 Tax=Candidatus Syntrophosphaera thermopropionivorans TaxID=2593015 RepID=A0AC61QKL8_9BACT|nr:HPr family phosphocarrier protein [Candidatus Syntrophosphaera thermopropionivorans]MBP9038573.1 HPr family phosphocarrier protein [Candidatus Syntrophosphaera sp.]TDF74231.1 HPr family phosphocarrier protein [Candidatus Syntrophosphaera thermopropionivorans]HOD60157.1 HPr family phosphocarrier protein [Candidatus Syntrophosphaera sp.]HQM79768.1 HPr family phosphocarrier protein [Candidatus Syntrophosphaera sp.]